ncbi:MAG: hypothetical protein KJ749_03035, partial [Planctomycetes bacterium]|nr:hypothetical protein [Planctomycetota bacterium]
MPAEEIRGVWQWFVPCILAAGLFDLLPRGLAGNPIPQLEAQFGLRWGPGRLNRGRCGRLADVGEDPLWDEHRRQLDATSGLVQIPRRRMWWIPAWRR